MKFLEALILRMKNIIYPPRCMFCRRMLSPAAVGNICVDCIERLPFCKNLHRCVNCGRPVPEGVLHCYRCGKGLRAVYHRISAVYLYEGAVKRALLRFKKEHYRSCGHTLALQMAITLREEFPYKVFDYLVAVPPRKKKTRFGKYDQADALTAALARETGIPYLRKALRQKEVRAKQSALDFADRWANVLGNFETVKKKAIRGKRILLVDDICTTGATLNECAKMLKGAGAAEVCCIVVGISSEEKFLKF